MKNSKNVKLQDVLVALRKLDAEAARASKVGQIRSCHGYTE